MAAGVRQRHSQACSRKMTRGSRPDATCLLATAPARSCNKRWAPSPPPAEPHTGTAARPLAELWSTEGPSG